MRRYILSLVILFLLFGLCTHAVYAETSRVTSIPYDSSKWDLKKLELSPDGKWLAAVMTARVYDFGDWLFIWHVPSKRNVLKLKDIEAGQGLAELAWHPRKPLLAICGGRDAPAMAGGTRGGLLLIDAKSRKRRNLWFDAQPNVSCAWMPDGLHVLISQGIDFEPVIVDVRNGRVSKTRGLWTSKTQVSQVTVSERGDMAALEQINLSETSSYTRLLLYSRKPGSFASFSKRGSIESKRKFGSTQNYPTAPYFLPDSKLSFARCGDDSASVWLTDANGKNIRYWFTLPNLQTGDSRCMVSISSDGRCFAYQRDGRIHVKLTPAR